MARLDEGRDDGAEQSGVGELAGGAQLLVEGGLGHDGRGVGVEVERLGDDREERQHPLDLAAPGQVDDTLGAGLGGTVHAVGVHGVARLGRDLGRAGEHPQPVVDGHPGDDGQPARALGAHRPCREVGPVAHRRGDGQHVLTGAGRDRALAGQGIGDSRLRHPGGARDVVAGGLAG